MKVELSQEDLILINLILLFLLKIVVFVLGFLTIRLGAALLREGVSGKFKFKASFTGAKADLQSSSPGLLFTLLGIILIGFAMAYNKQIIGGKEKTATHVHTSGQTTDTSGTKQDTTNFDPTKP